MKAVSIKLRATDAGETGIFISIFINARGRVRRERMRAYVDHSVREYLRVVSDICRPVSLSSSTAGSSFRFRSEWKRFFVRSDSDGAELTRLLYGSESDPPLCTVQSHIVVEFIRMMLTKCREK